MGRVYEKWHICKCLVFHAENLVKVYTQKNSGYTKSRRKIRQQKIPKIDSKFLHIELLSREAWASKDTRFLTLSINTGFLRCFVLFELGVSFIYLNCICLSLMQIHAVIYFNYINYSSLLIFCCQNVAEIYFSNFV